MKKTILMGLISVFGLLSVVGPVEADRSADCVAIVEKAVAFVQEKGKDYAVKTFSCSKGPFIDKELYVFAVSMDNVMPAHPWKAKLIGQDLNGFADVKGTHMFREFRKVAETSGSGWVDYWWWLPGEDDQVPKRTFIKRVPGTDMYVGAGYYPDAGRTAVR